MAINPLSNTGVSPETLVRTHQGLVPARDLPVALPAGPAIAHESLLPAPRPLPIAGRIHTGPGLRITTKRRESIAVAPQQSLLCIGEDGDLVWRRACYLKQGDHLAMDLGRTFEAWMDLAPVVLRQPPPRRGNAVRLPDCLTPETAMFWGLYMANGSVNGNGEISVSFDALDLDLVEWLEQYLRSLGLHPARRPSKRRAIDVRVSCARLVQWMEINDCRKTPRNGSATARVPEPVLRSPREVVAAFLSGYLSADGTAGSAEFPCVSCATVSARLAFQVSLLLRHLGLRVRIDHGKPTKRLHYVCQPIHQVSVIGASSTRRFFERINFLGKRKRDRLGRLLERDPPRVSRHFYIRHAAVADDLHEASRGLPSRVRADIFTRKYQGSYNLDWLNRLLDAHPQLRQSKAARLQIPGITYESIQELEPVAEQDWVSLETAGKSAYANGFIVNTG